MLKTETRETVTIRTIGQDYFSITVFKKKKTLKDIYLKDSLISPECFKLFFVGCVRQKGDSITTA